MNDRRWRRRWIDVAKERWRGKMETGWRSKRRMEEKVGGGWRIG